MREGNLENVKSILDFIGDENTERIKTAITNALIKNLEESIAEHWVAQPKDFVDLWGELFAECRDEVKEKYKETILKMC